VDYAPLGGEERNAEEWAKETRDLFRRTVSAQLVSDVPLGVFLSGGVDSSIIAATMAQVSDRPIETFSIGFEDDEYNELPYARSVACRLNSCHNEFVVRGLDMPLLEAMVWEFDEPFADSSSIANFRLAEMARRKVTVALSGAGGDELFAGYQQYRADRFMNRFDQLPFVIRKAIQNVVLRIPYKESRPGRLRQLKRMMAQALFPPERRHIRYMTHLNFHEEHKDSLYSEDLKKSLNGSDALAEWEIHFQGIEGGNFLERALCVDLQAYLPNDILCLTDRMSMYHSLEVRVPFLDHEFVEFALSIPSFLKLNGSKPKFILEKAFAHDLPLEVFRRPKHGFGVPIGRFIKRNWKWAEDLLSKKNLQKVGFFNPDYVRSLFEEHLNGRVDHSHRIWMLINFEIWRKTYLQ